MNTDLEEKIIDIVCSIPVDQWNDKANDGRLYVLFKGDAVGLYKSEYPDRIDYIITIEGINFTDNDKCVKLYKKINEYLQSKKEEKILGKIEDIYKKFTCENKINT